jgi:hypothetical protein
MHAPDQAETLLRVPVGAARALAICPANAATALWDEACAPLGSWSSSLLPNGFALGRKPPETKTDLRALGVGQYLDQPRDIQRQQNRV